MRGCGGNPVPTHSLSLGLEASSWDFGTAERKPWCPSRVLLFGRVVKRILLIEDEPRISAFLTRALSAEGFGVNAAYDGVDGLGLAHRERYDMVVLDLMLPGIDGVSVLRDLMGSRPELPVLVLSAVTDVESKVKCLTLGAFDYVAKPFQLAELIVRIRKGLRQRRPVVAPDDRFLRVGRAALDVRRREVDLGDGPVSLSTREFLLLEHLMRKHGDVCTREELLAAVWGYTFDPGTNVVDVYVGRLRSKVGNDVIQTVRNVGYSFDPAP